MSRKNHPYNRRPLHPNFLKRRIGHDYNRPARYLITIMKAPETGVLSRVVGNPAFRHPHPDAPVTRLTEEGGFVENALAKWCGQYPQIRIEKYAIMPDHVHICLFVHAYLKCGLSRAVANLMGKSTRVRYDSLPEESRPEMMPPFFSKGFNDRIAYDDVQWERQQKYVEDNPRRYLIKRLFPEYYRNVWIVSIGDWQFYAVGNVFLLKNPDIQAVRFSRKFREDEFERYVVNWKKCVENTGVLVSPFIHPKEKEIRDYSISNGTSIIRICEKGFEGRFSPQGMEFELMSQSRLLLVYPEVYENETKEISYNKAREMNGMAARIAGADWFGKDVRIRSCRK